MIFPEGMCVFAACDTEQGLADARAHIEAKGYTKDDVKLVRRDGQVLIITKREL